MFHPSQSSSSQGFRRLWAVGLSVGLALCLAGCPGPDSSTKSSNAQKAAEVVKLRLLVVGGSSSEIAGGVIGHNSTYELGEALANAWTDLKSFGEGVWSSLTSDEEN